MKKLLTLIVHRTFFVLQIHDAIVYEIMYDVTKLLKSYKYVYNRRIRRMVREIDKNYFSYDQETKSYRFTINILKDVLGLLGRRGIKREEITLINVLNTNVRPLNLEFKKEDFALRDYQQTYSDILVQDRKIRPIMLVDLATGYGKMQPLDTKIRVPDGWRLMRNIKEGDLVMTRDGTYTKVLRVFPHKDKKMYKFTFYDGRTSICGADHLWVVYTPKKGWRVIETYFLYKAIQRVKNSKDKNNNGLRFYIPLVEPEKNKDKPFIIHPYVLGCILGNGGISSNSVNLHIHDDEIIEKLKKYIDSEHELKTYVNKDKNGKIRKKQSIVMKDKTVTIKNKYRTELIRLGLLGKLSIHKFIPEEYLNGSEEQRWELLRGLMDTDGYIGKPHFGQSGKLAKCGTIQFATSSPLLRDTFITLVRSLGGIVSCYIKHQHFKDSNGVKKRGKDSYVMTLRLKHPDMCVTRTSKRAERLTHTNQYSNNLKLRINNIEEIGKMDAQCLYINHPSGLYVCDDYVVTHNTTIAAHTLTKINEATMILVLPKYIEKWIDDMYKYTNIQKEDICVIQGSKGIISLMNMNKLDIKYKVFIASITTMNYMISDYEHRAITPYQYPMAPYDFMDHLGVGLLLNDETHQHFHALLKISLYMNVNQIIGLSATLDSNRSEMKKLYNYMFPPNARISNIAKIERYIYVRVVEYSLSTLKGISFTTKQGYSHIAYEQSILKSRTFTDEYFKMIHYYIDRDYIKRRNQGERLLIFMSTVAMCTAFTNYLKNLYPSIDIRRYVEDDPYENVITAEISVSTVISASTAIDIPNLITVINTISMASLQANLQSMGRLRKIKDRDVWYEYLYCPQIPNQKNMHKIRRDTIRDKARLITYDSYPITIMTK